MERLPETSITSLKNGSWYVFKDGKDIIRLKMSNKGREEVYFNETLVSEREKKIKTKTEHTFVSRRDDHFKLVLVGTFKLNEGGSICTLYKNNVRSQELKITQNKKFMNELRIVMYPSLVFYIICMLLRVFNHLSISIFLLPILFFLIMLIRFIRMKIPLIQIENTTEFLDD